MKNSRVTHIFFAAFLMLLFMSQQAAVAGSDMRFGFPLNCRLNANCFISSYFDLDRRIGFKEDYQCGDVTQDNQTGIHISLPNYINTKLGFDVLAAADGEVVSTSQGAPDLVLDSRKLPQYRGSACGNGVLLEHEGGWFTRYCHLKDESLRVSVGQNVLKGQKIGEVGASGKTDWPRLDFSVSRNNYLFDPFSGKTTLEGCGGTISPLWDADYAYSPFAVMTSGFIIGPPDTQKAKVGTLPDYEYIPDFTPDLSMWAMLMNVKKGDRLIMQITDPNGFIFNEIERELDFNAEREVVYLYTKKKNLLWDVGVYKGIIKLIRRQGADTYEAKAEEQVILYDPSDDINFQDNQ